MNFEFATAGRILFGEGVLKQAGSIAADFGRRALVVCGGTPARVEPLLALLAAQELPVETYAVSAEPTVDVALQGVESARVFDADLVIGMGGGSAIDAAKAIAALWPTRATPMTTWRSSVAGSRWPTGLRPSSPFPRPRAPAPR